MKYLYIIVALFLLATPTYAATILFPSGGGTGRGTLPISQLIYGSGLNPVGSVATTSVTCSGSASCTPFTVIGVSPVTISASGGGTGSVSTSSQETAGQVAVWGTTNGYPAKLYGVATSTPTVSAPLTYSGTLGSFVGGVSGTFGCTNASSGVTGCITGTDWNTFNGKENVLTFNYPLSRSTNTISFGGLGTTSPWTQGQIAFVVNGNTISSAATTSVTCSGNTTCTAFTAIGASPVVISSTGGGTGLATTSPTTNDGYLIYNSAGAGSTYTAATTSLSITGPFVIPNPIGVLKNGAITYTGLATTSQPSSSNLLTSNGGSGVYGTATTSLAFSGFPANLSGTLGALVSGTNTTWTYWGLATTSQPASSNLLVSNGGAGVYGVATTSVTCSGTVSCTTFNILGATPITITGSGGSGGGIGWASSTPNTNSMYSYATGYVGIGTTTPRWNLQLSTSTAPQLALSTGGLLDPIFVFRADTNSFNIATASPSTFATTTASNIFSMATSGALCIGMGCTPPFASGLYIRDQDGSGPSLYMGGNNGGDTDWKWKRFADNDGASDDRLVLGTTASIGADPSEFFTIVPTTGNVGLATSSPWGLFSINPTAVLGSAPRFVVGSSTGTSLIVDSMGEVGIGTTSPWRVLAVNGTVGFQGLTTGTGAGALCLSAAGEVLFSSGANCVAGSSGSSLSPFATSTFVGQGITYPTDNMFDFMLGKQATTTAPFWWDVSATSTYIGNGGVGTSTQSFSGSSLALSNMWWNMGTYNGAQRGTGGFIIATSSVQGDLVTNPIIYIDQAGHFAVGTTTVVLDTFNVDGPINNLDWSILECKAEGAKKTGQIGTDITGSLLSTTLGYPCGDFSYIEDGAAVADFVTQTGSQYVRLRAGATGTTNSIGDGMGMMLTTAFMTVATNTPKMEIRVRTGTSQFASSTVFAFGFTDHTGINADFAAVPTNGCFFAATSTDVNWEAICKVGASITAVNTGIATSTVVTGNSAHENEFRIEMNSTSQVNFYTKAYGTSTWTLLTTMTTNIFTGVINPMIGMGKTATGQSPELDVSRIRVWYKEPMY